MTKLAHLLSFCDQGRSQIYRNAAVLTEIVSGDAAAFANDPLACWIEMNVGLDGGETLKRRTPRTVTNAADDLATTTGLDAVLCRQALANRLVAMSECRDERDQAFMAFKLHRFLSGAGNAHSTIAPVGHRRVSLAAEKFDREETEARLYPVFSAASVGRKRIVSRSMQPVR